MRAIGLDIGTTTLCAVVLDGGAGAIIDTVTENNESFIAGKFTWEKLQDPAVIHEKATRILEQLLKKHAPIGCIGVTGQMHGIVYLDSSGNAVSPLYSWQDGRGDLPCDGELSYAEYLSNRTAYKLATGYGAVTHFYNTRNGLAPSTARFMCTISDFIALRLVNGTVPVINPSNAASLGLFDLETGFFDTSAIHEAEMGDALFPAVVQGTKLIGVTDANIPVAVAIGDNQAGFLGSVKDIDSSILVNIGTGSQISMYTGDAGRQAAGSGIEIRPFADKGLLLVGAPLCGGSAYMLLEAFFRSVVYRATGIEVKSLYDVMDKYAEALSDAGNKLEISTLFRGTREHPQLRGAIKNIGMDNFTPQHLTLGFLEGMVDELFDLYTNMPCDMGKKPVKIVGSGNGIRKNNPLQRMIAAKFNMRLEIPVHKEEAAFGAALFALTSAGYFKDIPESQKLIRYREE